MKKPVVFKPIDINDKIDKFCENILVALLISAISMFITIAIYIGTYIATGNDTGWALYIMVTNLSILAAIALVVLIADNLFESKYSSIGHQLKNGINYWEELGKLKEASNGKKSSSKKE